MPQYYFDRLFDSFLRKVRRLLQNLAGDSCSRFVVVFTDQVSYVAQERGNMYKLSVDFSSSARMAAICVTRSTYA